MDDNLNNTIHELTEHFSELEKQSPNFQLIDVLVQRAHNTLEKFNAYAAQTAEYNQIIDRLEALQQISNIKILDPFKTEASQTAALNSAISQLQKDSDDYQQVINYKNQRMEQDINILNTMNKDLTDISILGYKTIMELRECITKQTIIYAIQGHKSANQIYNSYLQEDEYLQLLTTKTRHADWQHHFEKFKNGPNPFYGRSLHVDYYRIVKKADNVFHSRDPLYKHIARYVDKEKSKKLSDPEAWEAYVEAKQFFQDTENINMEKFQKFMGDWIILQANDKQYRTIRLDKQNQLREQRANFNALKFYQGGDASTYSKFVQVQNKKSTAGFDAPVNIATIYNGLRYVDAIFYNKIQINIEHVKKLFTYSDLTDIPNNIVKASFDNANDYAQEQIEKTLTAYNYKKIHI